MEIRDRRTEEERKTHVRGVVARDVLLSGWGRAKGGYSRVIWAGDPAEISVEKLFKWVKARKDTRYPRPVWVDRYRAPKTTAHLSIYVVGPNHPSQK
jgi:hypothetical protein